ncbi:MAG: UvrB/UvrC motif-containing protein [Spirochaetales bacterium]|nr:UvrB/UvrC motif-containing protein [Spirochaetales bacterium]
MDISPLLKEWEYNSKKNIRIIKADDGRDILQVRKPLGIEQYEMDGRPDGKKPFGRENLFLEFAARADEYDKHKKDSNSGYELDPEDFTLLHEEALLYYYRYLILFQIGDYDRTVRDTEHNIKICDFLDTAYLNEEDKAQLLQYRPYIFRMNAVARALICIKQHLNELAKEILEDAIREIKSMYEVNTTTFQFEKMRSLNYLKSMLEEIADDKKVSMLDSLKIELEDAVKMENYEKAAEIRDKIQKLSGKNRPE